jgi:hypothetical protein
VNNQELSVARPQDNMCLFDAYEDSEYREHMEVDFVRVVEEKENP